MGKRGVWLFLCIIYIFFGSINVFAQFDDSKKLKSLEEKVIENKKLSEKDPESAIQQLEVLIKQSIEQKQDLLELKLLSERILYSYHLKLDFEKMLSQALQLNERAIYHKNKFYEAKAHKYLAQVYYFNKLYDKSMKELQTGLNILDKGNPKDSLIIIEKANHYIAFANLYSQKGENFNALNSLKNALKEHDKLEDPDFRRKSKFLDYSNLGGAYLKINTDSAKYYADLSMKLGKDGEFPEQVFLNNIVIGNVYKEKKQYDKALHFYKIAESTSEDRAHINVEELYDDFIEIYKIKGKKELQLAYELKLKEYQLSISENKNNSLRKIIEFSSSKDQNSVTNAGKSSPILYLFLAITLLILVVGFIFLGWQSKHKSSSELGNQDVLITAEKYLELFELFKRDEKAFYIAFQSDFPQFIPNLTSISQELTKAEIELLMLLKLDLSNKEIAQHKFIQPKTLQNRRNKVRKKLQLSPEVDLNRWLEKI